MTKTKLMGEVHSTTDILFSNINNIYTHRMIQNLCVLSYDADTKFQGINRKYKIIYNYEDILIAYFVEETLLLLFYSYDH